MIEIDITSCSKHRRQVYAALQIPELWRFDGRQLTLLALRGEEYVAIDQSIAFPKINARAIEPFLQQAMATDYLELVNKFRQWLQNL